MDLKNSPEKIQTIAADVKKWLFADPSGHDWWHIYRVWKMAKHIAREEGANEFIVETAAILHEILDPKIQPPFPHEPVAYLSELGFSQEQIKQILHIIKETSFKGAEVETPVSSIESACVQDADRLDAIGAIGIARVFAYGGATGQPIHNPEILPFPAANEHEYRTKATTSINHFYEKLLLLKDRIQTETGRLYAEKRHQFLLQFLHQFQKEWNLES